MTSRNRGVSVRRAAFAVGAGVLGSLALAAPGIAAAPIAGVNCATDGKITGRGATFAFNLQLALADFYKEDVCGPVPVSGPDPDGAGPALPDDNDGEMVVYNYYAANNPTVLTGSGNGQRATYCRSDAFGMSDTPVSKTSTSSTPGLTQMRTLLPTPTNAACAVTGFQALTPPFTPTSGPYPNAADTLPPNPRGPMQIPIAGGAVVVGINLPDTCPAPTGAVQLTQAQISGIFGGMTTTWGNVGIAGLTPANCTQAILRVVRADNSGTTTIFKNFLKNADNDPVNTPPDTLCDPANPAPGAPNTWTALASSANNIIWPGTRNPQVPVAGCSSIEGQAGTQLLVPRVEALDGSVGYADASDWPLLAPSATTASLQKNGGGFESGDAGCSFGSATLPGVTPNDAVGLSTNLDLTWAVDSVGGPLGRGFADVTYTSGDYPACGLTWALVWNGLNKNTGLPTANSRLTANQRRTLFSYYMYVLSPTAQSRLASAGYSQIKPAWVSTLRTGFKNNF